MESSAVTPLAENKCRYCLAKLNMHYIKCEECDNINICIPCFSCGVEGGSHKKHHQYLIKSKENKENLSILHNTIVKWTWEEEKKLLDALELYAIGNWVDIAEKVGSKTPDECHQHYSNFYINGCMGQLLMDRGATSKCHVTDHTSSTIPAFHQTASLVEANPEEQLLLGYMPKRDDFERDYDNDAESILCKLHPSFEKDDLEEALKVAQISIYTHRLKERQRRKSIAREHNLIPYIIAHILNKKIATNNNSNSNTATTAAMNDEESESVHNSRILSKRGRGSSLIRCAGRGRGRGRPLGSTKIALNKENGRSFNGSRRSSATSQANDMESSSNQTESLLSTNRPMSYLSMLSTRGARSRSRKPYNAFHIEERLKPFLRYFTGIEGKQFLENLEREDRLRKEITELAEQRRKGKTKMSMVKLRDYSSGRVFVNGATSSRSISDDTRPSLPRGRGRGRKRGRKKLLFSLYQNYKMRRRLLQKQDQSEPDKEIKSE